jgi:hypothetical protein
MPKSKTDKKRKKRVDAFKAKIQSDRKRTKDTLIKGMQEAQSKEMEAQIESTQNETNVEGLGEFSMENDGSQIVNNFAELGLNVEQVELSEAPPDSFAGKVK